MDKPCPKLHNNLIAIIVAFQYEIECFLNVPIVDVNALTIEKGSQMRRVNATFSRSVAESCRRKAMR
jgi:hypothetical protein